MSQALFWKVILQDLRDLWRGLLCPIGRFLAWPWVLADDIIAFDPLEAVAAFVLVLVAGAAQCVFLAAVIVAATRPEVSVEVVAWMMGGATVVYVALTLIFHRPEKEKNR